MFLLDTLAKTGINQIRIFDGKAALVSLNKMAD